MMMRKKLTRREFLKSTGVTFAAIAAAGMLTACGGGDTPVPPTPTPTPDPEPSTDVDLGRIKIGNGMMSAAKQKIQDGVYSWRIGFLARATEDVTLTKSNFKATSGNEELVFLGFLDIEKSRTEKKAVLTDTLLLKKSDSYDSVLPCFRVSEEKYNKGGEMAVTIMNDGKEKKVSVVV